MRVDEYTGRIALTMIPGIGPVISKKLIKHCGSAEAVFREKKNTLEKIPGIGKATAQLVDQQDCWRKVEEELARIQKLGIEMLYFTESNYPERLTHCYDSPPLLYYKGTADLNAKRIVSVIGTRNITEYGTELCQQLIADLAKYDVLVVSGLAYGVDICAHRASLEQGMQTIGVLGHGLDEIYPRVHTATAKKMLEQGGLLSDFPCGTRPDRENFPQRNRIVAGLSDAVIVVESGERGGSMITAEFAMNYNRDVFAFPGRVGDAASRGCNAIIKRNKAALIDSADDVAYAMRWDKPKKSVPMQTAMRTFNSEEEKILFAMQGMANVHIDEICLMTNMNTGKAASLLLNLEFSGAVKSLPGKMFRLN